MSAPSAAVLLNRLVDNLPAAVVDITTNHEVLYSTGFPLGGRSQADKLFIFNHVRMTLKYHQSNEYEGKRVVGFDVHPMSIQHVVTPSGVLENCDDDKGFLPDHPHPLMHVAPEAGKEKTSVTWSYDVFYVPSEVRWASRWDVYLSMGDRFSSKIHWFSILNSVLVVAFLTVGAAGWFLASVCSPCDPMSIVVERVR